MLILTLIASAMAKLDPTEKQIAKAVKRLEGDAISLLEETVAIDSGTHNVAGVREVGAVFSREFEALGMQTSWAEVPPALQRAGHLLATHEGSGKTRILLIGHLDTVFEGDQAQWERKGTIAKGPGAQDMKGGDVVIWMALKALKQAGVLDDMTVRVVMTGDEESAGRPLEEARAALLDAAKQSDVALGFEGSSEDMKAVVVARRGASGWNLEVTAKQGHSSQIFRDGFGYGAVYETARILDTFRRELPEEYLTFNPGLILGGSEVNLDESGTAGQAKGKRNIISPKVVVRGDLRTISQEQLNKARLAMTAIVEADNLPETQATITFADGYPPMSPSEQNLVLLEGFSEASQDLKLGKVDGIDPSRRGAADISFVAPYVPGLDGLGLNGRFEHSPEEEVDLDTLVPAAQRAAVFMYRLSMQGL